MDLANGLSPERSKILMKIFLISLSPMLRFGFFPVLLLHELTKHSEICMISQSNIISFDSLYYNVIFVWFILWRENTLSLLEMAVCLMSNPVVLYFIVRYQSSSFSPIVVLGRYFTFFYCLCTHRQSSHKINDMLQCGCGTYRHICSCG